MSVLAKYLESVRVDKNLSLDESAKRSNMSAESYKVREQQPETVPLYVLASMFSALDMTRDELLEFNVLTSHHLQD